MHDFFSPDMSDAERADAAFQKIVRFADAAADLDNAAGYNVAINALKYAASIMNPAKYGKQVTDAQGNVAGYIIETGIRRAGDPGYQSGDLQNEQENGAGSGLPTENADLGGQDHVDGMDID